jgi:hypothetical protein
LYYAFPDTPVSACATAHLLAAGKFAPLPRVESLFVVQLAFQLQGLREQDIVFQMDMFLKILLQSL